MAGHEVAAGRDLAVSASGPGVAAGVIHGNVIVAAGERERIGLPVRLAPRPGELAGREALLAVLRERLSGAGGPGAGEPSAGSAPRVVALHGMGGAGKTTLAVEYAHRHRAEFGVVWQFAADDRAVLEADFARLSALLAAAGGLADPRDPVGSVHAVLAASPVPWLLIFDNAPDPAAVREFLPGGGPGQVLITSQHGLWPAGQGVEVPVLDGEVAALFLVSRSGDADLAAARDLAGELGGLPLALEQAAAYALAAGLSLGGYLGLFRLRRAELLDRGEVSEHPASVTATIGLAVTRLEEHAPDAAGLLRLLACLAPEPVPVGLLLSDPGLVSGLEPEVADVLGPLLGNPLAMTDAIAALRRYSLITPAGDAMVLVHRLVQEITLGQMLAEVAGRWRHAAAVVTEAAIPPELALPGMWPACAALLPHATVVLDLTGAGIWRIASYVGYSGSYAAARDLFRRIAEAHERAAANGGEHRDILVARYELASWTGQAGDAAGARDLFSALLPDMERVFGPEHTYTLTARHEFARWTGDAGNVAGARDLLAALLPIEERVLGSDHRDTLKTHHEFARFTGQAGDVAGARDLFAALLPAEERVLGPEHSYTLAARHQFATVTGDAGDVAGARDLFAALLPVEERVLGVEHPFTLAARHQLATFTGNAGDPAGARDLFAALLADTERVLGPEHPETLNTRRSLEYWTKEAGSAG